MSDEMVGFSLFLFLSGVYFAIGYLLFLSPYFAVHILAYLMLAICARFIQYALLALFPDTNEDQYTKSGY
jgi:hypothetical protein